MPALDWWGGVSVGNFIAHAIAVTVVSVLVQLTCVQLLADLLYSRGLNRAHEAYRRDQQHGTMPTSQPIIFVHRSFHVCQFGCAILLAIRAVDPVNSLGLMNWDVIDFCSFTTAALILTMVAVFFYFTLKFWYGLQHRVMPHEAVMRSLFVLVSALMYIAMGYSMIARFWTRDPLLVNSIYLVWSVSSFLVMVSWVTFYAFRLWAAVRSLTASKQEVRRISQERDRRTHHTNINGNATRHEPSTSIAPSTMQLATLGSPSSTAGHTVVVVENTQSDEANDAADDGQSTFRLQVQLNGNDVQAPGHSATATATVIATADAAGATAGDAEDSHNGAGAGAGVGDEPSQSQQRGHAVSVSVSGNGAGIAHASPSQHRGHMHRPAGGGASSSSKHPNAVNRSMRKLFILLAISNCLLVAAIISVIIIAQDDAKQTTVQTLKTFSLFQWAFFIFHVSCTAMAIWYAWLPNSVRIILGRHEYTFITVTHTTSVSH